MIRRLSIPKLFPYTTLFRSSERKFRNEYIGYYAVANADNATLLSIDERFSFPIIPRRVKGGMGQSNVWYADSPEMEDRKSTRLNSSHVRISYAVFCLKKKNN